MYLLLLTSKDYDTAGPRPRRLGIMPHFRLIKTARMTMFRTSPSNPMTSDTEPISLPTAVTRPPQLPPCQKFAISVSIFIQRIGDSLPMIMNWETLPESPSCAPYCSVLTKITGYILLEYRERALRDTDAFLNMDKLLRGWMKIYLLPLMQHLTGLGIAATVLRIIERNHIAERILALGTD